jgi:hypothetical protein
MEVGIVFLFLADSVDFRFGARSLTRRSGLTRRLLARAGARRLGSGATSHGVFSRTGRRVAGELKVRRNFFLELFTFGKFGPWGHVTSDGLELEYCYVRNPSGVPERKSERGEGRSPGRRLTTLPSLGVRTEVEKRGTSRGDRRRPEAESESEADQDPQLRTSERLRPEIVAILILRENNFST